MNHTNFSLDSISLKYIQKYLIGRKYYRVDHLDFQAISFNIKISENRIDHFDSWASVIRVFCQVVEVCIIRRYANL